MIVSRLRMSPSTPSVTGGWVSVKDVPSKPTSPRQHVSGADRFISAVFQAASFRGGSF